MCWGPPTPTPQGCSLAGDPPWELITWYHLHTCYHVYVPVCVSLVCQPRGVPASQLDGAAALTRETGARVEQAEARMQVPTRFSSWMARHSVSAITNVCAPVGELGIHTCVYVCAYMRVNVGVPAGSLAQLSIKSPFRPQRSTFLGDTRETPEHIQFNSS